MKVSPSGFYEWLQRQANPCRRHIEDARLTGTITEIWTQSRGTYGSPRVWAELKLGQDISVSRKRVERLMKQAGIEGVYVAVVLDAWSRRVIGWSMADHLLAELVVDALDLACWGRKPDPNSGLIQHADHGTQGGFNWWSQHLEMEVVYG